MPKFSVRVETDTPLDTKQVIEDSGIPTIGPASAGFTESPESSIRGNRITAVVEADGPEAAVTQVRQAVGSDAEVGPAEPYGT